MGTGFPATEQAMQIQNGRMTPEVNVFDGSRSAFRALFQMLGEPSRLASDLLGMRYMCELQPISPKLRVLECHALTAQLARGVYQGPERCEQGRQMRVGFQLLVRRR